MHSNSFSTNDTIMSVKVRTAVNKRFLLLFRTVKVTFESFVSRTVKVIYNSLVLISCSCYVLKLSVFSDFDINHCVIMVIRFMKSIKFMLQACMP